MGNLGFESQMKHWLSIILFLTGYVCSLANEIFTEEAYINNYWLNYKICKTFYNFVQENRVDPQSENLIVHISPVDDSYYMCITKDKIGYYTGEKSPYGYIRLKNLVVILFIEGNVPFVSKVWNRLSQKPMIFHSYINSSLVCESECWYEIKGRKMRLLRDTDAW